MKVPVYPQTGRRTYSKLAYCFYCEKEFRSKIKGHYVRKHSDQPDVKKIILCKVKSQRDALAKNIEYLGNYKHNIKVIYLKYFKVESRVGNKHWLTLFAGLYAGN